MRLNWTKSYLPLSLLIRAITGQDCSHFSFEFELRQNGLVFESNLLGCVPAFLKVMMSGFGAATVVHTMELPLTQDQEDQVWAIIVAKYAGQPYDYLGALYTGLCYLLHRISFGKIAIPEKNAWSQSGTYYCDELYNVLTQIPEVPQVQVDGTCKTPHDLWEILNGGNVA